MAKTWAEQQIGYEAVCKIIDDIKTPSDFYKAMDKLNSGRYSLDLVNSVRESKKCFNSAQYAQAITTPSGAVTRLEK